jgi:hypothetical protein
LSRSALLGGPAGRRDSAAPPGADRRPRDRSGSASGGHYRLITSPGSTITKYDEVVRCHRSLRRVRQEAHRHATEPLAPSHQAPLEPQHPARRAVVNGTNKRVNVPPASRQARSEARLSGASSMQGVVKMYDPLTREGIVVVDTDRSEVVLADARRTRSSGCCARVSGSCSSSTATGAPPTCAAGRTRSRAPTTNI